MADNEEPLIKHLTLEHLRRVEQQQREATTPVQTPQTQTPTPKPK